MRARSFLVALCLGLSTAPVCAGMIETEQLLAQSVEAQREHVQRQLEAYGVSPADAASRAAALTEAELQVVSAHIESLPAGAGLTTLEAVLLIILLVVLLV